MIEEKAETEAEDEPERKTPEPKEPAWRGDAKQGPDTASGTDDKETEVRVVEESVYAPIANEHHLGRLEFVRRRLPAKPWMARVFVRADGQLVVFGRGKQPTTGELLWGGFRSLYEVDLSLQRLVLEITLPSTGDAFVFRAHADVQWRVDDPERVVASGVTDIRRVLVPRLLDSLRQATRCRQPDEVEAAEKEANALFKSDWLTGHGLWTNVLVRLRMDKQKESNVRLESEVRVFKTLIAGGDLDQFALQLAQNPEQVQPVVEALFKERDAHRAQVYSFLQRLLETDVLDRWQIDDKVRVTLDWLQASIRQVLVEADDLPVTALDRAKPATNGAGS